VLDTTDGGKLKVVATPNQDTPAMKEGVHVLLGIDVWEHAYCEWTQTRRCQWWWLVRRPALATTTTTSPCPVPCRACPALSPADLRYQNKRAAYIDSWWGVVNWKYVNDLFAAAKKA